MLNPKQKVKLLTALEMLVDFPRRAETQVTLADLLGERIDPSKLDAYIRHVVGKYSVYPGPKALVIEYDSNFATVQTDASPEQKWGPKPAVCERCNGLGSIENPETRMYESCSCPDAIEPDVLEKLNAKFSGKQPTSERRRMVSTARFMERVGL